MAVRNLFDQPLSLALAEQLRARARLCDDAIRPSPHRLGLGRLPAVSHNLKVALRDTGAAYRAAAVVVDHLAGDGVRGPADPAYPGDRMLSLHKRILDAERRLRQAHRRAEHNRQRPQDHRGR